MSSNIPATHKAIKCYGPRNAKLVNDAPVPDCPPDYMLVKIGTVALNPTDWKHVDLIAQEGYHHTVGCDYAGTVVQIGSAVTKSFSIGDRVVGFSHGMKHEDPEAGCFAEYAKVKGDIQIKIPAQFSFEEAASWPTGINTVGQGMYMHDGLQLPWPNQPAKESFPLLIYGASTNTGVWAIQFAKLSGLRVLAVCSERNFEAVKALGADDVFDYHDEKCGERVAEAVGGKLMYAFDCVSEGNSMEICAAALTKSPPAGHTPRYGALLPVDFSRKDVKTSFTIGYSVNGEAFTFFGNKIEARPKDFEFGKKWWALAQKLLAEGSIKGTPTVRDGGLQGVFQGLDDLKNGKVRRQKLVYRVADTA